MNRRALLRLLSGGVVAAKTTSPADVIKLLGEKSKVAEMANELDPIPKIPSTSLGVWRIRDHLSSQLHQTQSPSLHDIHMPLSVSVHKSWSNTFKLHVAQQEAKEHRELHKRIRNLSDAELIAIAAKIGFGWKDKDEDVPQAMCDGGG